MRLSLELKQSVPLITVFSSEHNPGTAYASYSLLGLGGHCDLQLRVTVRSYGKTDHKVNAKCRDGNRKVEVKDSA